MTHRRALLSIEPLARAAASLAIVATLTACATPPRTGLDTVRPETINLPLIQGWFDGRRAYYVTTDMSDAGMSGMTGANYVPRLANALPPEPRVPGAPSSTDRIYKFPNAEQASVLPSAPEPLGPGNASNAYSPLWQIVNVTWNRGVTPVLLRSEREVLEAEDVGRVTLEITRIVVNCPVVRIEDDLLRGASLPRGR